MIVYRIADKKYINDREGIGAKLFGGRWNEINVPCLYTSEHISLAFLEKFIYAKGAESMLNLALLKIEVPNDLIFEVDVKKLKKDWADDIEYSQWLGQQLLADLSVLAFKVPSSIIEPEFNVVINVNATKLSSVIFHEVVDFTTEHRLINLLSS
ncbi:RES family NAD+ phosphorylase [Pedobacter cryotolerans]|uniref:RES domain-containing protein n=1 Tax=Pedobacter cryotolerans TaxID=2571270 RepID=A0A4U1C521_9SPHI|nr:RES family NAD+ phosphorylase [Pedobacter cryotolerans]TKB98400.1 RES domain-containing protein [Pedobacter cryotolerans]